MDNDIGELAQAARDASGSEAVLKALLRAARETADPAQIVGFLSELAPAAYKSEDARLRVADFLIEFGAAADALDWAAGDTPKALVLRARATLVDGDRAAAARHYRAALASDASVRDAALDAEFAVAQAHGGGAEIFDLGGRRIETPRPAATPAPGDRERVTFADVGGHEDVKAQIRRRIVHPFARPALFQRFRKKAGGGVLMFGPPGCGKTLLARATAGECAARFVPIHIPEILDMYIGQSEKRLAAAFEQARRSRPTVLFIDEIEALAARRKYSSENAQSTLVSTFLSEMDGISASNEGVLVLAATNVPWAIDPAFRRPGRFDRVVFVPPPDEAARRAILRLHLADRPRAGDVDIEAIAARTSGFSGADIAGLVDAAVELAIEDSMRDDTIAPLTAAHFRSTLTAMRPSTLEWLSSARNYAKYANQGGLYDEVAAFLDKHAR
ncbi:MAG: ATP-binding protein [Phyllobacteriaceae bacterium]|nr:ATP-binding protein [Phyllobacteriaceae bacterium]